METQNDNKPSYKDFIQNDNTLDNILSNTLDTEEYKNNNYGVGVFNPLHTFLESMRFHAHKN